MNTQENNKMIAKDLDNNKYEILWGDDKPFQSGDMAYNPMSGIVIEVYFDENDEYADDEYYVQETYAQVKKLNDMIQENNTMIAEFMGARLVTFNGGTKGHTFWNDDVTEGRYGSFPNGATNYFEYDKGYHTSWDWLMPVVEKIYQLDSNADFFGSINFEATYKEVVEFINQYNKKQ